MSRGLLLLSTETLLFLPSEFLFSEYKRENDVRLRIELPQATPCNISLKLSLFSSSFQVSGSYIRSCSQPRITISIIQLGWRLRNMTSLKIKATRRQLLRCCSSYSLFHSYIQNSTVVEIWTNQGCPRPWFHFELPETDMENDMGD